MRTFLMSLAVTGVLVSGAVMAPTASAQAAPASSDLWHLLQGYYYGTSDAAALAACEAAGATFVAEHTANGAFDWLCRPAGTTSYALFILYEA